MKVADKSEKVGAANPGKMADEQEKVPAALGKLAIEPEKVDAELGKDATELRKVGLETLPPSGEKSAPSLEIRKSF